VEPMVYTPVSAAANLRRSVVVGAVLGVAAIVITSVMGHPLMGLFGALGLALGALNNKMLQQSVLRFAVATDVITKKQFGFGVARRLLGITIVAVGAALFVRPDGLGVFAGLAVFQVLMLVGAAVPVFHSLRPTTR
jgi:hypothetical protein